MKEGFMKLDGQDKPQKIFYDPSKRPIIIHLQTCQRYSSVVMNDQMVRLCL